VAHKHRKPSEVIQSLNDRLAPGFTGSHSQKSLQKLLRDARRALEETTGALAIIQTWCEFEGGRYTDAVEIAGMCRKTREGRYGDRE